MKAFIFCILTLLALQSTSAQNYKPYILALESTESVTELKTQVVANLELHGIEVIGQYQPADDSSRWVIVFSSDELISAVQEVGGRTAFGASLRLGITEENGTTLVSYTNPEYWGRAYFRGEFDQVAENYVALTENLQKAMEEMGNFVGTEFGSGGGISARKLSSYRYMISMPRFDNSVRLEEFDSHQAALDKIDTSIESGVSNVELVYKLDIPDQDLVLYGFALSGEKGEGRFLPIIDFGNPKHTAFLPYEILVMGDEVHMLHGRYRIALSFPDLKMRTFSRIMSTPGDIEKLMRQLVE